MVDDSCACAKLRNYISTPKTWPILLMAHRNIRQLCDTLSMREPFSAAAQDVILHVGAQCRIGDLLFLGWAKTMSASWTR